MHCGSETPLRGRNWINQRSGGGGGVNLYNAEIFCTNHENQIWNYHKCLIELSDSFEYLCYGSTAIRNILLLSAPGFSSSVRIWCLKMILALKGLRLQNPGAEWFFLGSLKVVDCGSTPLDDRNWIDQRSAKLWHNSKKIQVIFSHSRLRVTRNWMDQRSWGKVIKSASREICTYRHCAARLLCSRNLWEWVVPRGKNGPELRCFYPAVSFSSGHQPNSTVNSVNKHIVFILINAYSNKCRKS